MIKLNGAPYLHVMHPDLTLGLLALGLFVLAPSSDGRRRKSSIGMGVSVEADVDVVVVVVVDIVDRCACRDSFSSVIVRRV